MPQFAASDLGLRCLPMSHKKDARLIWVKMRSKASSSRSSLDFTVATSSGLLLQICLIVTLNVNLFNEYSKKTKLHYPSLPRLRKGF